MTRKARALPWTRWGLRPQTPIVREQGVWLILGASSAIARAFARQAAAAGADIILAGRDQADLAYTAADLRIASGRTVSVAAFDALDRATHAGLAERLAVLPGIVNIALMFGIMPDQATMDADAGQALACIDTGFAGAVAVLQSPGAGTGKAARWCDRGRGVGRGRSRAVEELCLWGHEGGAAYLSRRSCAIGLAAAAGMSLPLSRGLSIRR